MARAAATESWAPNVPVARANLEPAGVEVWAQDDSKPWPADDGDFTLVLNRHGRCDLDELWRVLQPGGTYLTQTVGRDNDVQLNEALEGPAPHYRPTATLDHDAEALREHGFEITASAETFASYGFGDIGAVVFHLSAVSWQVPGFDVETYDAALRRLDAQIRRDGELTVLHHRYHLRARRP